MDPTEIVCLIRDSFTQGIPPFNDSILPQPYSITLDSSRLDFLGIDIKTVSLSKDSNLQIIYCDKAKYTALQKIKDAYFDFSREINNIDKKRISSDILQGLIAKYSPLIPQLLQIPTQIPTNSLLEYLKEEYGNLSQRLRRNNPFESVGNSIFLNRAAIKLANIDAIYHLTGLISNYVRKTVDNIFKFCDLAGGPGGFSEYLLYRCPQSLGYGITLKGEKGLDWSIDKLDLNRFKIFYGDDNTGNLYTNWNWFIDKVGALDGENIDLIVADGGFDVDTSGDYERQEFLTSRLILTECLIGLSLLKKGGSFVVKVFDTVTEISAQTLYILSCCFEKISIFKPVSSRWGNSERYVICWSRHGRESIVPYVNLLREITKYYKTPPNNKNSNSEGVFVSSFLKNKLPEDFTLWLTLQNNQSIDRISSTFNLTVSFDDYQKLLADKIKISRIPTSYDTRKALILWNLPSTPQREK
jgi:23S rRNA U2552 (ribose-2'-O)-methylase RlmE/FtsJ